MSWPTEVDLLLMRMDLIEFQSTKDPGLDASLGARAAHFRHVVGHPRWLPSFLCRECRAFHRDWTHRGPKP